VANYVYFGWFSRNQFPHRGNYPAAEACEDLPKINVVMADAV